MSGHHKWKSRRDRRAMTGEELSDDQADRLLAAVMEDDERYVPKTDEGSGPIADPEPEKPS